MKKIYALALAVAVTLSASAAVKGVRADRNEGKNLSNIESVSAIAGGSYNLELNKPTAHKVRKAGEALPDPTGTYACLYTMQNTLLNDMVEVYEDFMGDGLQLFNLFGFETDIPCSVQTVEFNTSSGSTQDFPCLVIAGGGTVPAFTYNGTTYYVFLAEYDNPIKVYTNDVEFIIDEETGTLQFPYGDGLGIAFGNLELGRAYYIDNPNFYKTNGLVETLLEDYQTESMVPADFDVYAEQYDNSLYIFGFCGYQEVLTFTLDLKNNTAQAVNQLALESSTYGDFYYFGLNAAEEGTATLNASFKNEGTGSVLTFTDAGGWMTYSPTSQGYWDKGKSTTITFDFPIKGANGVVDAAIATDNNAPVEYFNLQGVRVNEPAAGNLYIVRQGEKVSKVIVR